jgi:hypothetical protein
MHEQPGVDLDNRHLVHQFKNYLAVVVGFCDLLLGELPGDDPRHKDVAEIRKAAQSALGLVPEITRRLE